MRLRIAALLIMLTAFIGVGCGHSQVPPVLHSSTWTWGAPVVPTGSTWGGCTSALPCKYIVSTLVVSTGTTTCPVPDSTHVYNPQNASSPTVSLTYQDFADSGTLCAVAQTVQGNAISAASVPGTPVVVLPNPLAPSITGTTAELKHEEEMLAYAHYHYTQDISSPKIAR